MPDLTKGEFPSEVLGLLFTPLVLSVLLRLCVKAQGEPWQKSNQGGDSLDHSKNSK